MKRIIAISIAALMTGCAAVTPMPQISEAVSTPVTIFRSAQLQGSVTDTYIGWDEDYYVALAPKQATTVQVPSGLRTFRIRAHADLRNELTLALDPGEPVCLMAEVNPNNIVGLNWLVPGYQLQQIPCMDDAEKAGYTLVSVAADKLSSIDL